MNFHQLSNVNYITPGQQKDRQGITFDEVTKLKTKNFT